MMKTTTHTIPAEFADLCEFKLSKIAKRADKKGMSGLLEFSISGPRALPIADHERFARRVVDVTINGVVPKVEGWEFIAKLTHDAGNFVTVLAAPGKEVPALFRESKGGCDHCNKIRRRKDTFVLFDGTDHIEVGRTCLKDFFPSINVQWVVEWFNFLEDMANGCSDDFEDHPRGFRPKPEVSVRELLMISSAVIRRDGWMSKTNARKIMDETDEHVMPTADTIHDDVRVMLLGGRPNKDWEAPEITDADEDKADAVIEFVRNDLKGDNEFVFNLKNFFSDDMVQVRFLPFVASAIPTFDRSVSKAAEMKAAKAVSNHVGEVGDKITAEVEVTMAKPIQSHFGMSMLFRFVDATGNTFVTFNSGSLDPEVGSKIKITGTVKSHDDFKGFKSTMLKRVKEAA